MERLKRPDKGVTLIEIIIAMVLFAVVAFAASKLLISFGNFSSNFVKSEASLMGTALGAFEEITGKITAANAVAINKTTSPDTILNSIAYPGTCLGGSCIQIRVSPTAATGNHTNDTVYTYWQPGTSSSLLKAINGTTGTPIAGDITSLLFKRDTTLKNHITVTLKAQAASGPPGGVEKKEHLVTTAIMRSRSAQAS